jgi:hypothetical protein
MNREELLLLIKRLQWSGTRRGQGSGYMGSGGDGTPYPACPVCSRINPKSGARSEFMDEAIGHKKNCKLALALRGAK